MGHSSFVKLHSLKGLIVPAFIPLDKRTLYVSLLIYPTILPNIFKGTAYLSKLVWKALDRVIKSAKVAMKWLQDVSKLISENGLPVVWTTPTNAIVQMVCPVLETKRVNTYMGEKIFRPKTGKWTPDIRKTSIAV